MSAADTAAGIRHRIKYAIQSWHRFLSRPPAQPPIHPATPDKSAKSSTTCLRHGLLLLLLFGLTTEAAAQTTAGITVNPASVTVAEDGGADSYTVVLNTLPAGDVAVMAASGDTATFTLDPPVLTFDTSNWNQPQTVTVTGVNDDTHNIGDERTGTITHTISTADGGTYTTTLELDSVEVTVTDDDDPVLTVEVVDGHTTIEEGRSHTIQVAMDSAEGFFINMNPIDLQSAGDYSHATSIIDLEFDPSLEYQTRINEDDIDRPNGTLTIDFSSVRITKDFATNIFVAGSPTIITLTIIDNDPTEVSLTGSGGDLDEGSTAALLTIELGRALVAGETLSIPLALTGTATRGTDYTLSGNPAQGVSYANLNGGGSATITFAGSSSEVSATTATLLLSASDDMMSDAGETIVIESGTLVPGAGLGGGAVATGSLTFTLQEGPALRLEPVALTIDEGSSDDYTVALAAVPSAQVSVTVSGDANTNLSLSGSLIGTQLFFSTANWNQPQTITVTVDEDDDGRADPVTLLHSASGGGYAGISDQLTVTPIENDRIGVTVSPTEVTVAEAGGTTSYRLVLDTEPADEITITVTSGDVDAATVNSSGGTAGVEQTLMFSTSNWNQPQAITVTGVNDDIHTIGGQRTTVITHTIAAGGGSSDYPDSLEIASVAVTVTDDDDPPIISITGDDEVIEGAGTLTYILTADKVSAVDLTINLTINDVAGSDFIDMDGDQTVIFSAGATTVTYTIPITDDDVDEAGGAVVVRVNDGDGYTPCVRVRICLAATEVFDDDVTTATLVGNPSGNVVEGGSKQITLTLNRGLVGGEQLLIPLNIGGAATLGTDYTLTGAAAYGVRYADLDSAPVVAFDGPAYGATARVATLTLRTLVDADADAGEDITIEAGSLTVLLGGGGTVTGSLSFDITEQPELIVQPASLTIGEGSTASYSMTLASPPSGDVTVSVSGQASTDLVLSGSTLSGSDLTFTTMNWNQAQNIMVMAAADDDDTPDTAVTLLNSAAGGGYDGVSASVAVTIIEADTPAGLVLEPAQLMVPEGMQSIHYTVRLAGAPTAPVTVVVTGVAGTGLTLDNDELTFTPANWASAQQVTLTTAAMDSDFAGSTLRLRHTASGGNYISVTADLSVTLLDGTAGVLVMPSGGNTVVSEDGARTDNYTLTLSTRPVGDVVVRATAGAGLSVNGAAMADLTFTPVNWNQAQRVTIAGIDDDIASGALRTVPITHAVRSSADSRYPVNLAIADLVVMLIDDDTAGLLFSSSDLTLAEGGTVSYTVALGSQPTDIVRVNIVGGGAHLTASVSGGLAFGPDNWSRPATVLLTANADDDSDDEQVRLTHLSTGGGYDVISEVISVRITDRSAGVDVTQSGGRTVVREDGGEDSYTLALNAAPEADVTIAITTLPALARAGVTVDPTSLTFTTGNWQTPQQVTVTGVDDDRDAPGDGRQVNIRHAVGSGDGAGYTPALSIAPVLVTVQDDDTAGLRFSRPVLAVVEGGSTSYGVRLTSEPTAVVTVAIASDNGDLVPDESSLMFSTMNWSVPQTVTVTAGTDSDTVNNDVALSHTATRGGYDSVSATLGAVLLEGGTAGVSIVQSDGRTIVTEGVSTDFYEVVLNTAPDSDVTVTVNAESSVTYTSGQSGAPAVLTRVDANSSVTVNGATTANLVFTPANWHEAQPVTVAAVDNNADDGVRTANISHTLSIGDNDDYGRTLAIAGLTVTVNRDPVDSRGNLVPNDGTNFEGARYSSLNFVSNASLGSTHGANEVTTLPLILGGNAVRGQDYQVRCGAAQRAWVFCTETEDGQLMFTLDGILRARDYPFTPGHRHTLPLEVELLEDNTAESAETLTLRVGENGQDFTIRIMDRQAVSVEFTRSSNISREDSFAEPFLRVNRSSSDFELPLLFIDGTAQAGLDFEPPSSFTFSQSPTRTDGLRINFLDDQIAEGNESFTVVIDEARLPDFVTVGTNAAITVTITDNDVRGLVFDGDRLTLAEGGTGSYTVRLSSQPIDEVTVVITGQAGTDLMPDRGMLTFSTANWNQVQTVLLSTTPDSDGDADRIVLVHTASGGGYGLTASVQADIIDSEAPEVRLNKAAITVSEDGSVSDDYTLVLHTEPAGTVTVTLDPAADVTVQPGSVIFMVDNWDTPQAVTVTGVNSDDIDRGDGRTVTIAHAITATGDADDYPVDLPIDSVRVTLQEDDEAGVTIVESGGSTAVSEDGGITDDYTVVLTTQPAGRVVVRARAAAGVSVDTQVLGGLQNTLTFTSMNWQRPQTVTVAAVEDAVDRGDRQVLITHAITTTAGGYVGRLSIDSVSVRVVDNDAATRLLFDPAAGVPITEGSEATYTVQLAGQPLADVTVDISGHDGTDVTPAPLRLTFTTQNWHSDQTVTLTATTDDNRDDERVTLTHSSSGGGYDAFEAQLEVVIADNDMPGASISKDTLTVTEDMSGTDSYTVVLDILPLNDVNIRITDSQAVVALTDADGNAIPSDGLVFTSVNWNQPQTVIVTGSSDDADNPGGEHTVTIEHTASSTDSGYNGIGINDVTVTLIDADPTVVTLSGAALDVIEGTGRTLTVSLERALVDGEILPVPLTFAGTAIRGTDYTLQGVMATGLTYENLNSGNAVVIFTGGTGAVGTATLTFNATADTDDEGSETVTIGLGTLDENSGTGLNGGGTGTSSLAPFRIIERPMISLAGGPAVTEGSSVTFTLTASEAPVSDLTINLMVTDAVHGDFLAAAREGRQSITFTGGTTSVRYEIPTVADTDDEANDTVMLTLLDGNGYVAGSAASATTVVNDNDATTVTLAGAAGDVGEGAGKELMVTLSRGLVAGERLPVALSFAGTATRGTDYRLTGIPVQGVSYENLDSGGSATVTFAGPTTGVSVTEARLTLTALMDGTNDAGETVIIGLGMLDADSGTGLGGGATGVDRLDDFQIQETPEMVLERDSLMLTEAGSTTYTVGLSVPPTANVTVTITGQAGTDLRVDTDMSGGNTLTFSPANWSTTRAVTLSAVSDTDSENEAPVTLTHTASGGNYDSAMMRTVAVSIADNTPGLVLSIDSLAMEEGDTTSYTVRLALRPVMDVTVRVVPADAVRLRVTGGNSLTFTSVDWDRAQTVTVMAEDDTDSDANRVTLTHTADAGYGSVQESIAVDIADDDVPRLLLNVNELSVTEGSRAFYMIALGTRPSGDVTVTLSGHGGSDLMPDVSVLTFSSANWEDAQTVTVTALDDGDSDDDAVTLTHRAAGGGYDVAAPVSLPVRIIDNTPALVLSTDNLTLQPGGSGSYTVALAIAPASEVTVNLSGHEDTGLTVAPVRLAFSTDNWNMVQAITVTAGTNSGAVSNRVILTHTAGANYGGVTAQVEVRVGGTEAMQAAQSMWLPRFGLTAIEHMLGGLHHRFTASDQPGLSGNLNGLPRGQAFNATRLLSGGGPDSSAMGIEQLGAGSADRPHRLSRTLSLPKLLPSMLRGSHFTFSDEDGTSLWGRASYSSYKDAEDDIAIDGKVTTAMLGVDHNRGRTLLGLALAYSDSDGEWQGESDEGDLSGTLVSLLPYLRYDLTERLQLWGAASYGQGDLEQTSDTGMESEHDLEQVSATLGLRGTLLERSVEEGGLSLKLTSDMTLARIESDDSEVMAGTEADTQRFRMGLEWSWRLPEDDGVRLTPELELGLRYDGGDTSEGFGLELGGGLSWQLPARGLTFDVRSRYLLEHEASEREEWGLSGSLRYDARPDSAHGPSFSLRHEYGNAPAASGLDRLLSDSLTDALKEDNAETAAVSSRWTLKGEWGFALLDDATGIPYASLSASDAKRDLTLGWRLLSSPAGLKSKLDIKAIRREQDGNNPRHSVGAEWKLDW